MFPNARTVGKPFPLSGSKRRVKGIGWMRLSAIHYSTPMISDSLRVTKTVSAHDDSHLAVHRLWIAAVELLAMITGGSVVALKCSWFVFAACSVAGFPLSWLFALQIVGATPPPALIDLNMPALLRSVFTPAIGALRRGLREPN